MNNIPHVIDSGSSYEPETKIEFSLKITQENPDGSADAIVRMNKPAMECILQWGIIKMIEEGIKTYAPVSTERRKPRANASSAEKRRSRSTSKAKTRVASKTRKDTKTRTRKI
jgi:hypothetical protein